MIKHALTALSIGFLIFILYILQYTGAFKSVTVGMDQRGPYTLIYKQHTGAYHEIVSTIQDVETWAKENKIKIILGALQMPPNYGSEYAKKYKQLYPKLAAKLEKAQQTGAQASRLQ